jgi:hypothetical protein
MRHDVGGTIVLNTVVVSNIGIVLKVLQAINAPAYLEKNRSACYFIFIK